MKNDKRFAAACETVRAGQPAGYNIGTYKEKTLHSVLKYYYSPEIDYHEVKLGRYIADIMQNEQIIEIQTGSFTPLRGKLAYFVPLYPVTVVYPVPHVKWISWIDPQTGEVTKKRKSPKQGSPYSIFGELYKIKDFLTHEHFHLRIVMLDLEEYRNLDGWSRDRKKGSHRHDRIPVGLDSEIVLTTPQDYMFFIPEAFYETEFTIAQFGSVCQLNRRLSYNAVKILNDIGLLNFVGKRGNAFVYALNRSMACL
jgi:hypothetical protein